MCFSVSVLRQFAPYKMSAEERARFEELLRTDEGERRREGEEKRRRLDEADEYEQVKLY